MTPWESVLNEKQRSRTPLGTPVGPDILDLFANSPNARIWALNHPEPAGPNSPETIEAAERILNLLPKRQRQIVELVIMQGLPYPWVAHDLGITERAVRKHLSVARHNILTGSTKHAPCGTVSARKRHKRRGETCTACAKPQPSECGTWGAYHRHRYHKEPICDLCREAVRNRATQRRQARTVR